MFTHGAFPKEDSVSTARIEAVYANGENIGLALRAGLRDLVSIRPCHSITSNVGGVDIGDDCGRSSCKARGQSSGVIQRQIVCI